jgi:2-polyprenyl-6-methoxyphenol hydroxylase-like FAD-dependent oxidoreductase
VRTLVVGGGVGGLTAAIAFRRRGFAVDLVEQRPDWSVLGVGLSLGGAPLRALNALGLAERCLAAGFGSTTLVLGDAAGEVLQVLDRPRLNGPEFPSSAGIMRPALHGVLVGEAEATGATLRLGTTVTELREAADAVDAVFSDGTSGAYDVVVGADGLWSRVRELVFPEAEEPWFTGQAVWRAMLRRPTEVTGPAMYYGPRNKAGLTPVSLEQMYLFLVQSADDDARPQRGQLAALLREQLAGYDGLIGRLREQIVDDRYVDYRPLHALLVPPPWHRGRVVLIGDAVHATTPHLAAGAGLAIEDAVVLAELFDEAPSLPEALERFTRRRFERCRFVVETSLQLGEWEKRPDDPDADPAGLSQRAWAVLGEPI